MKHLLSIADLGRDGIEDLLRLTDSFVEVSERSIPKVPALRGRTVVSLFDEDRRAHDSRSRRPEATVGGHDVVQRRLVLGEQGESLRDTVETIEAMASMPSSCGTSRRACPGRSRS